MGADVIKVERPDGGDPARDYDGVLNGVSAYFAWLNRGKRSIVLDLKQPHDRELCARLLDDADVFVHNLAPAAIERLALGYDRLAEMHPRLIWCGISGYGPDGPLRDKKAYDMLVQAEAGVVSITGSAEAPAKVGVSIGDISAGLYGYSSILAALYQRERTGTGGRVDISMLECLTEWMMPALSVWRGSGVVPERAGVRHNMIVPYGAYACADGDVMLAVLSDREWRRFCAQVLGAPALASVAPFASQHHPLRNRVPLDGFNEARFRVQPRAEVLTWLDGAGIPTGAVNDVPAVVAHPQLVARRRWTTVASPRGEIPALVPPHNLQHAPPRMGAVPALGEHTAAIIAELDGKERAHD